MMDGYTKDRFQPEGFLNPAAQYRGVPFWAWNCRVDEEKIVRDAAVFKKMGFGGANVHSRYGLENAYLSEEFMDLVQTAERSLKEQGLFTWLYDEDRWPSGGAGGLIAGPKNASRCLLVTPFARTGADCETKAFPDMERFCENREEFLKLQEEGEDPDGYFLGQYEVLLEDGCLKRYSRCEKGEKPSFGGEMWYAYLALERNDIWYSGFGYVDTLNPRVIREFLEVTHERYKEACGEHFGTSIPAIFTDEPQFAYKESLALPEEKKDIHMSFTDDLDEGYREVYQESLLDSLPELIWELPRGQVSRARYRYHDYVAERFSESYFEQLYRWCQDNGILLTGHAVEESTLWSQTRAIGEAMRCYHHLHIPGIDMLCDAREYSTAKQAQSVSRQDGRDGVMSELYGVTNWDFTFRGYKLQGDWQAAMGITHRVPHLSLMSMEGASKRDYPASFHYQAPWYQEYKQLEDYFARVNMAMRAGTGVVHVGVIHPIESYWLHWGPMLQTALDREEMEERFRQLIEWLTFGLQDFDFISERLLKEQYGGSQGGFHVGKMCYDVIIVPACKNLRSTTLSCLWEFAKSNGRILFLDKAGAYVDVIPSDGIQRLAEICEVIPFSKGAVLNALEREREVEVTVRSSGRRAKDIMYQLRQEGEKRFLFLCNTTKQEKPHFCEIQGEGLPCQKCDVSIKGIYEVTRLDAATGEMYRQSCTHRDGKTWLTEEIYAAQSMLYLLTETKEEITGGHFFEEKKSVIAAELWPKGYSLAEPNVLLLDMPEYSVNGREMRGPEEILRIWRIVNQELHYHRGFAQPWSDKRPDTREDQLQLRFVINSQVKDIPVSLGIERPEYCTVFWNGSVVTAESTGWYVDEAIQILPLGSVHMGENELMIQMRIGPKSYIEPMYLLGEFGVSVAGRETVLTELPARLTFGDVKNQGMAFYSGSFTYHCEYESDGTPCRLFCHDFSAPLLGISVNGKRVGSIFAAPYEVNLGALPVGRHSIDITVFGNRHNTLGPLHNSDDNYQWYGECAWETAGAYFAYEYHLKPFGIFTCPRILK